MPAQRKTLEQLVRDHSFLARRHEELLFDEPLVGDPRLRQLQERCRCALEPLLVRQYALLFQYGVAGQWHRVPEGLFEQRPDGAVLTVRPPESITFGEDFYAATGRAPGSWFRRADGSYDFKAEKALARRWDAWNRRHGLAWRVRMFGTLLDNADTLELYRRGTGETTKNVDGARERLPELVETFLRRSRRRKPIPDPPGWERFRSRASS